MEAEDGTYSHMENEIKKLEKQLGDESESIGESLDEHMDDSDAHTDEHADEHTEENHDDYSDDHAEKDPIFVPRIKDLPQRPVSPYPNQKKQKNKIPLITKPTITEFRDVDDFNNYYQQNKDEFETTTTHMLNKKYKIPGFKITKIKGVVSLKNIQNNKPQILETVNKKMDALQHEACKRDELNPLLERISALEIGQRSSAFEDMVFEEIDRIKTQLIEKNVITALNTKIDTLEENIVSLKTAYTNMVEKINEIIDKMSMRRV